MTLSQLALQALLGLSTAPATLQVRDAAGISLRVEVARIDSMSCAFTEMAMHVPALQNSAFDVLKDWAEALSRKITYLLEQLGPLEFDPQHHEALIRSTPPQTHGGATQYYEIVLSGSGNGTFLLRRYAAQSGTAGRTQVDLQVTHEVFERLINDLLATIPSP